MSLDIEFITAQIRNERIRLTGKGKAAVMQSEPKEKWDAVKQVCDMVRGWHDNMDR